MNFWKWITNKNQDQTNPATGLPMISDECSVFDVGGSPYGSNNHQIVANSDEFHYHPSNDWL